MTRSLLLALIVAAGAACSPGALVSPPDARPSGSDSGIASPDATDAIVRRDVPVIGPEDARRDVPFIGPADSGPDAPVVARDAGHDAAPPRPCGSGCPANAHCLGGVCRCDPYFSDAAGVCTPFAPTDPATHAEADVCNQWREGHRVIASTHWLAGTGGMCDHGSVPAEALDDALRRTNMYRWLVGLAPMTYDEAQLAANQHTALMEHLRGWPPGNMSPHRPTADWACYTAEGAAAAVGNLAWGYRSVASAVDGWIDDGGNGFTMGHRRWILYPALGTTAFGHYDDASVFAVRGWTGGRLARPWYSYPAAGAFPVSVMRAEWTFHAVELTISSTSTVTVTRVGDGMNLPVRIYRLPSGYGDDAIGWQGDWSPRAGDTYRITIDNLGMRGGGTTTVTYEVRAVTCA